ncbi:MAG: hypothetical protein K9L17_06405 [Clostridiales bacterium]|nr:hypothetical protein [Clostridiales bacterium]MCF8022303.1 hypothetical protein [Clostridiales bacterium]
MVLHMVLVLLLKKDEVVDFPCARYSLSICHAVIEDTAIFMAVGANGFIILIGRFIMAVIITFLVSQFCLFERQAILHEAGKKEESKNTNAL